MEAPEQNGGGTRQRDSSGSERTPVFTVIQAQKFSYREDSHVAQYEGSVRLTRPNLEVRASKLRAHLLEQGGRTELEKAYADGEVEILHSQRGRTRRGSGENAEYYAKEGKLVLYGGEPTLVDSVRGSTRGQQLTWFINNDRLLVEGGPAQPAISRIQR
jgi:lipopolysaccharide transport protein LptA